MQHLRFNVKYLPDAVSFLESLDTEAVEKILGNVSIARRMQSSRLMKKLSGNIWELRTVYGGNQYRLFAFWDKRDSTYTLVVATHGIVKKTDKVPVKEIKRAESIREKYFKQTTT
jgi:phage-related protein